MSFVPKMMFKKQACAFVGCSASYIDRLRKAGKLKTYTTLGGLHMYYADDLKKHFNMEVASNDRQQ